MSVSRKSARCHIWAGGRDERFSERHGMGPITDDQIRSPFVDAASGVECDPDDRSGSGLYVGGRHPDALFNRAG